MSVTLQLFVYALIWMSVGGEKFSVRMTRDTKHFHCIHDVYNSNAKPVSYLCDGTIDCEGGEDEENCVQNDISTTPKAWPVECFDIDALKVWSRRCDRKVDCPRGQDEDGCPSVVLSQDKIHELSTLSKLIQLKLADLNPVMLLEAERLIMNSLYLARKGQLNEADRIESSKHLKDYHGNHIDSDRK